MNAVARLAAPDPMRAMTTETGCAAAQPQSRPQRVGVDIDTAHQDLDRADVARRKRLAQPPFAEVELLEHFEPAHAVGQPVAGQVGDVGVELPQPVPRGVVAHQTGAHHRAVGVDDPPAGRRHRAVVGFGVGDLPSPVSRIVARRRTPARPAPPTTGTPRARCPPATSPRSRRRNPSRASPSKSIPGAHFTTRSRPRYTSSSCVERRRVVARVEPAPPAAAPRGVDEDDGVAGDRPQRVGAAELDAGRRCGPPSPAGPDRYRCRPRTQPNPAVPQVRCRSNRSRRAPRRRPAATCPVRGHRCRGGLLQRLVGEQPVRSGRRTWPPPCAAAAWSPPARRPGHRNGHAPRRCRRPAWRRSSRNSSTSRKRRGARVRPQVGDVVDDRNAQDGLTPVTMTL